MKSKIILASLLAVFSAQSFATGTIHCTGAGETNKVGDMPGIKSNAEFFITVDYDMTTVGGITASANLKNKNKNKKKKKNKYLEFSQKDVNTFKNAESSFEVHAGDVTKNVYVQYDFKSKKGLAQIQNDGQITEVATISCDTDL